MSACAHGLRAGMGEALKATALMEAKGSVSLWPRRGLELQHARVPELPRRILFCLTQPISSDGERSNCLPGTGDSETRPEAGSIKPFTFSLRAKQNFKQTNK